MHFLIVMKKIFTDIKMRFQLRFLVQKQHLKMLEFLMKNIFISVPLPEEYGMEERQLIRSI